MAGLKNIVFCLSLLMCFMVAKGDHCIPGVVTNMTFTTTNNRLQWSAPKTGNCTIHSYIINIFDHEEGSQLQYQSTALYYDLATLDMCKNYTFEVHALTAESVIGPSDKIDATTPPGQNLNLTLSTPKAAVNQSQIVLDWSPLATKVFRCISYYRVAYWDENNQPVDVYVPKNSFTLQKTPIPCMEYKFQVTAVVQNPDIVGPVAETNYTSPKAVTSPPKLVNIVTTNSTATMTWKVPTYSENHCTLTALVINTLGAPANITNIRVPINDSPSRPNVVVRLTALKANAVYTSNLFLQNNAGNSKNVTASFQTSDSFVFNYETDLFYE